MTILRDDAERLKIDFKETWIGLELVQDRSHSLGEGVIKGGKSRRRGRWF
jgi:hypothetical protein